MATELLPDVHDLTCGTEDGRRFRVFLVTDGTPTLIDTGFEDTTDTLEAEIETVGVEPERLIITHGDPDHIGGFDAVVERYGCETYVPAETVLETTHDADHRYSDGDQIGPFEAIHTPGHEPDNYVLVNEESSYAIMGDAVWGTGLRGSPPGAFQLPPAVYSTDLNAAEENLERLLEYEFDAALVFHGESILENASEKLREFVNFPGKPE